jgi:hypothetical protein
MRVAVRRAALPRCSGALGGTTFDAKVPLRRTPQLRKIWPMSSTPSIPARLSAGASAGGGRDPDIAHRAVERLGAGPDYLVM